MYLPANAATLRPASTLPVRVTAQIRGSAIRSLTRADPMSRVWKQPSSNPASRKTPWMASAHRGTLEACFSNPTFPAINAGAAKRNTCQKGKFHGMTASTGPKGS